MFAAHIQPPPGPLHQLRRMLPLAYSMPIPPVRLGRPIALCHLRYPAPQLPPVPALAH